MSGHSVENGYGGKTSPVVSEVSSPGARDLSSSLNDSGCQVVGGQEQPGARTQRRHYKDFNRSTVFDYLKSPTVEIPVQQEEPDPDHEINMEHKQKRHFQNVNQSNLEL